MAERLTAAELAAWEPTDVQKRHGYQTFASRVLREGLRFEEAGNALQARLRYEKCRAYCELRQVPFPPFSGKMTALVNEVGAAPAPEPYKHGKLGPRAETVANEQKASKAKKTAPVGDVAERPRRDMALHGKKLHATHLCKVGQYTAAQAFCEANNLPWPPFPSVKVPISGAGVGLASSPPLSSSSAVTGDAASAIGGTTAQADAPAPESPSEPVSRPFQLDPTPDEIYAMFPDMRPPGWKPPLSGKVKTPAVQAEVAGDTQAGQVGSPALPESSSGGQAVVTDITPSEAIAPPEPPANIPQITTAPVLIQQNPDGSQRVRVVRTARIWSLCPNPKLMMIKFLDGAQELSSLWKPHNNLRLNDTVSVVLDRGVPQKTAIYEVLPQRV